MSALDDVTALATAAAARWGIERAPELIQHRENSVFGVVLPSGERAVLRVHRAGYHDDAAIRSELQWMAELSRQGIEVPQPIPDGQDKMLVHQATADIPQGRAVDVLSWVEGVPLGRSGVPLEHDVAALQGIFASLGAALAKLHAASDGWTLPDDFQRPAWDSDGLLGPAPVWGRFWELSTLSTAERRLIGQARAVAARDLAAFAAGGGDYGLIHADVVRENVLLGEAGLTLIDFDDGGMGWRLFELATVMHSNRAEPHAAVIEQALFTGYRSIRNFSAFEHDHLALFKLLRSFTYLGWIAERLEEPGGTARAQRFIETSIELSTQYLSNGRANSDT